MEEKFYQYILSENGFESKACMVLYDLQKDDISSSFLPKEYQGFFNADEMKEYESKKNIKRKKEFLLSRMASKKAFQFIQESDPKQIFIRSGIFHYPILHHPNHTTERYEVSLSHSDTKVASLIYSSRYILGLDIQEANPNKNSVILSQCTKYEIDFINKQSQSDLNQTQFLTVLWCAKEALSKALRSGLLVPFEILELEGVAFKDNAFYGTFKNFKHFQFKAWFLDLSCVCIVYPSKINFIQTEK